MGRTCSDIVPFLKRGLERKLYTTLLYIDEVFCIGRVKLPRKHKQLSYCEQEMLKAWDTLKGRTYCGISNYSKARQRFRQAMKKSIFIEKLSVNNKEIDFRFRTEAEVLEIRQKKIQARTGGKRNDSFSEDVPSPAGSCSSGYFSGSEDMELDMECQQGCEMPFALQSIYHDHDFGNVMWCRFPAEVKVEATCKPSEDKEDGPLIENGNLMIENVNILSEENANVSFYENPGMFPKTLNVPESLVTSSSLKAEVPQDTNSVLHDDTDWNSLMGELFERYCANEPFCSDVPQAHGDNGMCQLPDSENNELSQDTILRSIDFEAFAEFEAEDDIKADFSQADVSSIKKQDQLNEAQQSLIIEGTCRAWVCTTPPIKIDMIRQLVFKEKVSVFRMLLLV
ncbi:uncharacterized protein LOC129223813 [Uloborus diversus]|uniref:uncharacterized protein LOC129223813 n=1 Tax=Uloborus diversus TaxID=327109 RepID=UPI00240A314F|nr:uncharacterized protein LOC129223813 [Uloborus diversus]